jgi:cell division protein FtsB
MMRKEASRVTSLSVIGGDGQEFVVNRVPDTLVETPLDQRTRMRRRKERRRANLIANLKVALICIAFICVVLYGPMVYKLWEIRAEIRDIRAECDRWNQLNVQVMADISYARSDSYVRQAARETLGLVDKGAILYVAALPDARSAGDEAARGASGGRGSQALAMNALIGH